MANPSTAHEPSMEEILASIRQIISEDSEGAAGVRAEARLGARAVPEPASDDEPMALEQHESDVREHGFKRDEPMRPQMSENSVRATAYTSPAAEDFEAPPARALMTPRGAGQDQDNLLSQDSDTAVAGAFSALAHTILAQNARTLEDLVTEMLKPMLKGWLDDNLPNLVERLVKEEIERVSRGRR